MYAGVLPTCSCAHRSSGVPALYPGVRGAGSARGARAGARQCAAILPDAPEVLLSIRTHADPYRWVVLGVFLTVAGLSQAVWLNFAPLVSTVQHVYSVSEAGVLMLGLLAAAAIGALLLPETYMRKTTLSAAA